MMIFTESLFWEDPLWVNRDGRIYSTDSKGREFEIDQDLQNKYLSKFGGYTRLKPAANALGGAILGTAAGIPLSLAAGDAIRSTGADPSAVQSVALPVQLGMTIGGGILGVRRGINNSYNDIVRAKRAGEI